MSDHASVCPLDCPDTCSLTVTVENAKIVEDPRLPRQSLHRRRDLRQGARGSYPEWVHGTGRLQHAAPAHRGQGRGALRARSPGTRRSTSSTSASTAVIAAHGPQAVLPLNYAGPHGMLAGGSMDLRFFHKLGASLLDR